jgi:hypothetical protein
VAETANTKVIYDGRVVTARTRDCLLYATELYRKRTGDKRFEIRLAQGSFSNSVEASGSTHFGDATFDARTKGIGMNDEEIRILNRCLRDAGCATGIRDHRDDMDPHIHGIVLVDAQASSSAKWQMDEYDAGRNMLSNRKRDRNPYRPKPKVRFSYTLGKPVKRS